MKFDIGDSSCIYGVFCFYRKLHTHATSFFNGILQGAVFCIYGAGVHTMRWGNAFYLGYPFVATLMRELSAAVMLFCRGHTASCDRTVR